jgi:hypothetical protein
MPCLGGAYLQGGKALADLKLDTLCQGLEIRRGHVADVDTKQLGGERSEPISDIVAARAAGRGRATDPSAEIEDEPALAACPDEGIDGSWRRLLEGPRDMAQGSRIVHDAHLYASAAVQVVKLLGEPSRSRTSHPYSFARRTHKAVYENRGGARFDNRGRHWESGIAVTIKRSFSNCDRPPGRAPLMSRVEVARGDLDRW